MGNRGSFFFIFELKKGGWLAEKGGFWRIEVAHFVEMVYTEYNI